MDLQLNGAALDSRSELAALRLLVEAMVSALPAGERHVALLRYSKLSERLIADLLGSEASEAVRASVEQALDRQAVRLSAMG